MHITHLKIKNFRAITSIEVDLQPICNVIVGPNATGKTTLLEAIRLAKALVAPRTQNESNQTLVALGVNIPGNQFGSFFKAIAQNDKHPIHISCTYKLSSEELSLLAAPNSLASIANQMMLSGLGRQFGTPTDLIGIMSSPMGRQQYNEHVKTAQETVAAIANGSRPCLIDVSINVANGQITSKDAMCGVLIGF